MWIPVLALMGLVGLSLNEQSDEGYGEYLGPSRSYADRAPARPRTVKEVVREFQEHSTHANPRGPVRIRAEGSEIFLVFNAWAKLDEIVQTLNELKALSQGREMHLVDSSGPRGEHDGWQDYWMSFAIQ